MLNYITISTFIWDKHDRPVAYPTNLVSNSRTVIDSNALILKVSPGRPPTPLPWKKDAYIIIA